MYLCEAGGAAVMGSAQPHPIAHQPDGTLALDAIDAALKPDDPHFARTRLLALENTLGGRVMPMDYLREATSQSLVNHLRELGVLATRLYRLRLSRIWMSMPTACAALLQQSASFSATERRHGRASTRQAAIIPRQRRFSS